MSWPDYPNDENPYFGDGETYGRELGRVSPEGYIYGQERIYRDIEHYRWWAGVEWRDVKISGQVDTPDDLPTEEERLFGEIWQTKSYDPNTGEWNWVEHYWDLSEWKPLKWLWTVTGFSSLPANGFFVGQAHKVLEPDVHKFWDGFTFRRRRHSGLDDDEAHRHLPPWLQAISTAEVRLEYLSSSKIMVIGETSTAGAWVNSERLSPGPLTTVNSSDKSIDLVGGALVEIDINPASEYWIYWCNTRATEFNLPGHDVRGKLFLSRTEPDNGYLSRTGFGRNAVIAGRCQTDMTPVNEGGPYFVLEYTLSLISNQASLAATFREFSDYVVEFVGPEALTMRKLDGLHGQMYVPEGLKYIGWDYDILRSDPWVRWDGESESRVSLTTSGLASRTRYYIYIAGAIDAFNFNVQNPSTGRPWQESDNKAEVNYNPALDLRLKPFLSNKEQDHGRMSEEAPGYWCRWIGHVLTDDNGYFCPSRSLSAIRQPTLNPTDFDGLAEISISLIGDEEIRVYRKAGTSGVVNVNGQTVQTYDRYDDNVHSVTIEDSVWSYDPTNFGQPLSDDGVVGDYPGQNLFLYIANSWNVWGTLANRCFLSTTSPENGFMSRNWPGNNARWLATVAPSLDGKFSGSPVIDSISPVLLAIDDRNVSSTDTWSSMKISQEIQSLFVLVNASQAFTNQKTYGLPVRLEYLDSDSIKLVSLVPNSKIAFPDLSIADLPESITQTVTGSSGVHYYVYLTPDLELILTDDAPELTYDNMETTQNNILVGECCFSATDYFDGNWCVASFYNEPQREWSTPCTWSGDLSCTITLNLPGFVVGRRQQGTFDRTGVTFAYAHLYQDMGYGSVCSNYCYVEATYAYNSCGAGCSYSTVYGHVTPTMSVRSLTPGIYAGSFSLSQVIYASVSGNTGAGGYYYIGTHGCNGQLVLRRW